MFQIYLHRPFLKLMEKKHLSQLHATSKQFETSSDRSLKLLQTTGSRAKSLTLTYKKMEL